jgi:hypothetical protein
MFNKLELKRGKIITFSYSYFNHKKGIFAWKRVTAKITYIYKRIGPLGISVVPLYFYGIVNGVRRFFWVESVGEVHKSS